MNLSNKTVQCCMITALVLIPLFLKAQPTPIAFGETLIDTIAPPSDIEVFSTPVFLAEDKILIRVTPQSGLIDLRVRLLDQMGNEVASAQASTFELAQLVWEVPIGSGGTFNIIVSDLESDDEGRFCISLDRFNSPPEAKILGNNSSLLDTLACSSSVSSFKFTHLAGSLTEVVVTPTSGLLSPKMYVCRPNGDIVVADSTDDAFTAISVTVPVQPQNQCLYVLVVDFEGDHEGRFSISHSVLVGPSLTADIESTAANGIVCAGDDFTLDAITNTGNPLYEWSGPNGFTSDQPSISFGDVTPLQSGFYNLTVTDQNDCVLLTKSQEINVIAFDAVISGMPADGILCEASSFSLEASTEPSDVASPSYIWSAPDGTTVSTEQNYDEESAIPAQSGTYTLMVTDENGCTESDSWDITVNPLPTANMLSTPSGFMVCEGSAISLSAETDADAPAYSWTGPGINSSQPFIEIEEATLSQAGLYYLVITDANGCVRATSQQLTVHALPTIDIAVTPFDADLCEGEAFELDATTNAQDPVYSWQGPNGFTSEEEMVESAAALPGQSGLYELTITDANACSVNTSQELTINLLPDLAIAASPMNASVCEGASFSLTASTETPNVTYEWEGPDNFSSSLPSFTINEATTGQSGVYTVFVTGLNGCTAQASDTVMVNGFVAGIQTNPASGIVCEGDELSLEAITDAESPVFSWSGPDGFSSDKASVTIGNVTPAQSGTYVIMVTDINGCSQASTVAVEVTAAPELEVTVSGNQLSASATGGNPPYNYIIAGGNFGGGVEFPGTILVESGEYTCYVADANGCTDSAMVNVIVGVVDPLKTWGLTVSPNPSQGMFYLSFDGLQAFPLEVAVFDKTGRRIRADIINGTKQELDLRGLPVGLYMLHLTSGEEYGVVRLVITR